MEDKINQILQDLYSLDNRFKDHEAELRTLLVNLIKNQPDAKFDAQFAENLRKKLLAEASLINNQPKFMFNKIFSFSLVGLAAIALIVVGANFVKKNNTENNPLSTSTQKLFASNLEINKLTPSQSFGSLSTQNTAALGRGGGGGGASSLDSRSVAPASPKMAYGLGGGGGSSEGFAPIYYNYKFVYKGQDLKLDQTQLPVYKRIKGISSGQPASDLLKQLNFGLIDVSKFSDTRLQMLNIVEDKEFGYNFSVNLEEGTVNIYQNWLKWPNPEAKCRDQQCLDNSRIKITEVPSDEEIIAISNQFLKDHNISTESYGQPQIQNSWRIEYERMADKSQFYIPTMESVVYPLKINDQLVYDQSGNPSGLIVSVDARFKKVSGINELSSLKFDSSMYPAMTDSKTVLKYAENGGGFGYVPPVYPEGVKTVEVELDTPTHSLVKIYHTGEDFLTQELIVPALVFPIKENKDYNNYYQKFVVVPLIEELLQNPGGPIMY